MNINEIYIVQDNILKRMKTTPVKYPITRTSLSTHQMYSGTSHFFLPELYRGKLPHAIYFFMLQNEQHMGAYDNNPFSLQHYGLSEIQLSMTGFPYPSEPLRFDFAKSDVTHGYRWYLDNIGILDNDEEASVSALQYRSGFFMIPFDLSPTLNNSDIPHQPEEGVISATLRFSQALNHTLTIVTYAIYHNLITVDNMGEVFLDFAV